MISHIVIGIADFERAMRALYHPHYWGAYFRDPDGNKLCVVCHTPAQVEGKA